MTIDWKTLEDATAALTTLSKTGKDEVDFVFFSGLRVSLSELNGYFPPSGTGVGLSIYVDTLVVDAPTFNAEGINLIARSVDVSILSENGQMYPMVLSPPCTCFLVVGQTLGGAWTFDTEAHPDETQSVPTGVQNLAPFLLSVTGDGKLTGAPMIPAEALPNSLGRPAALNSLKASFVAATVLIDADDSESASTARSMLQWVVTCCETLVSLAVQAGTQEPSFEQLRIQAAALLVTLNVRDGVYYAPPLAAGYYKEKISGLIQSLGTYEGQIQALTTQTGIEQAIADVSATLQKNARAVAGAYQTQLDGISVNLATLLDGINTLQGQYLSQATKVEAAWVELEAAIAKADIKAYLKAVLETAMSAVKVGLAANPEKPEPGAIVEGVISGIGSALTALEEASKGVPSQGKPLIAAAQDLLRQQNEMTLAAWGSYQLWLAALGRPSITLPVAAGVVAVDPRIAWQTYMDSAESVLTNLKDAYKDSAAAEEVVNYLGSLRILTQLGMGIDANLVAYTAQLADGVALRARIAANQSIEQEWQKLKEKSANAEEQLLALKGLIATQADAIRRSIYASYRLYVSAYFFSTLAAPPEIVRLDMTSAQLTDAFNQISSWTLAAASDKVTLPVDDATLSLEFEIVKDGESAGENSAFLAPAGGGRPATLTFGFSIQQSRELATTVGHGGKVAIWIKSASVVLPGATPNSKNNVILTLSTSGSYVNGFGPEKAYGFVNGGVSGEYAYDAATQQAYIPWKIPSLVYSKPTPYTTWTIAIDPDGGDITHATSVVLHLTVALLTTPPA